MSDTIYRCIRIKFAYAYGRSDRQRIGWNSLALTRSSSAAAAIRMCWIKCSETCASSKYSSATFERRGSRPSRVMQHSAAIQAGTFAAKLFAFGLFGRRKKTLRATCLLGNYVIRFFYAPRSPAIFLVLYCRSSCVVMCIERFSCARYVRPFTSRRSVIAIEFQDCGVIYKG